MKCYDGIEGITQLSLHINNPPINGNCSLSPKAGIRSCVDEIEFVCDGWEDPEDMGVKEYVLYAQKHGQEKVPLISVSRFDAENPTIIRVGTGTLTLSVEVIDIWGAKALYIFEDALEPVLPTNEERVGFANSGVKEKVKVN